MIIPCRRLQRHGLRWHMPLWCNRSPKWLHPTSYQIAVAQFLTYRREEKRALLQSYRPILSEHPPLLCARRKKWLLGWQRGHQPSTRRCETWPTCTWSTSTAHWKMMHCTQNTQTKRIGSSRTLRSETFQMCFGLCQIILRLRYELRNRKLRLQQL